MNLQRVACPLLNIAQSYRKFILAFSHWPKPYNKSWIDWVKRSERDMKSGWSLIVAEFVFSCLNDAVGDDVKAFSEF